MQSLLNPRSCLHNCSELLMHSNLCNCLWQKLVCTTVLLVQRGSAHKQTKLSNKQILNCEDFRYSAVYKYCIVTHYFV